MAESKSAKKTEAKAEVKKAPVAPAHKPAPAPKPAPVAKSSGEWSEKGFSSERAYQRFLKKFS